MNYTDITYIVTERLRIPKKKRRHKYSTCIHTRVPSVLTVLPCAITLGAFIEADPDPSLIQSGLFNWHYCSDIGYVRIGRSIYA